MTATPGPSERSNPFQWRVHAGRALEAALNRALALDPDTRAGLRALDGRRVALALESPPLALQISVEGERLVVGPVDQAREPDLGVRATLGGLLSQLQREGVDTRTFDAFLADSTELERCLRYASACGALAVTRHGAFAALPTHAEAIALLGASAVEA